MASLSLVECCCLLAIDPKTLRQWLTQAQMAFHSDPANAKIKCLDAEQVQLVAKPKIVLDITGEHVENTLNLAFRHQYQIWDKVLACSAVRELTFAPANLVTPTNDN